MNFSVIIPLYNKEEHIKRAIDSVLQQTFQKFEIIVVDDGSTDYGYQEVKKLSDSRIQTYRRQNEGVSLARNFGIQQAKHEYIAFLDADDMWKPTFLESISDLIDKYPQAGTYATSYEFKRNEIAESANLNINLSKGQAGEVDYFRGALNDPLISASSVVIKKSVFNSIGLFSTDLTRGEDLEMWCRIALKYQIVFINEVLATYFLNSDNRATNTKIDYSKTFMSRAEKILYEQKKIGNDSLYFEEYMISRIMTKARYLIKNKRNNEARNLLWKYKHTKHNKKKWFKNYILSFKLVYFLYTKVK